MTDPTPDLTYIHARVNTPSVFLDGTEQDPAHHPHPDSAQALNEYHARYVDALDDESLDPLTRAELRTRVRFGLPVSGDLATLVRAGAHTTVTTALEGETNG